jgi:excisionase family DNA binding protein
MQRLLTTGQAAALLKVSREYVSALIREGRLQVAATYGAGHRLLTHEEVERLAQERKKGRKRA